MCYQGAQILILCAFKVRNPDFVCYQCAQMCCQGAQILILCAIKVAHILILRAIKVENILRIFSVHIGQSCIFMSFDFL